MTTTSTFDELWRRMHEPLGQLDLFPQDTGAHTAVSFDDFITAEATHRLPRLAEHVSRNYETPPADLPRIHLTGNPDVQREFFKSLRDQGRIEPYPGRPGWVVVRGSQTELAKQFTEVAAQVSKLNGTPLLAGIVHRDQPRGSWPGGIVLGAAENQQELQIQTTRALVADYPPTQLAAVIDAAARNPKAIIRADGTHALDVVERALTEYVSPRAGQGRSASLYEIANLAVNVEQLANTLGRDHPASTAALDKNNAVEAITRAQVGAPTYDAIKEIASADLQSSRGALLSPGKEATTPPAPSARGLDRGPELER